MSHGRIVRLELENFKSYAGKQIIGPFKNFSCVIGPNGSGKSNLMDAISFVMGLRANYLRSTNLKQLIYAAEEPEQATARLSHSAYVSLIFQPASVENESQPPEEVHFTRTITSTGTSEYKIDDNTVTLAQYENKLKEYGIVVKARNFLVFQGDVESIAAKKATELTKLFEQISGSEEYAKEYEKLQAEKEKASETVISHYQKKKGMTVEKTKFKEQKKEAKRYHELIRDLTEAQTKYTLWRFFQLESKIREHKKTHTTLKRELEQQLTSQKNTDQEIDKKKQELSKLKKILITAQRELKDHVQTEQDNKVNLVEIRVQIEHNKKQIVEQEKLAHRKGMQLSKYEQQMRKLESELEKVKKLEVDFEASVEQEQGKADVINTPELRNEYSQLKQRAGTETVTWTQERNRLKAEIESLQETEKQISTKLQRLEERQTQQLEKALESLSTRLEKLRESHDSLQNELNENRKAHDKQEDRVKQLKEQKEGAEKNLLEIRDKLNDVRVTRRETERETRFKEAVESMKRLFPGVHGRIQDLCTCTRDKYGVAVTVALGRHFHSIVVDKEKTALECIEYLKEQRISMATFIPLDTIVVKKVNEKLRKELGDENSSAKMILDVIKFAPSLEKAFRFALGNTLVCENVKEAMHYCFSHPVSMGTKTVSIDGTVIQKSGVMTGGEKDVKMKAQAWLKQRQQVQEQQEAVDMNTLKSRRDKYMSQLQEAAREEQTAHTIVQQMKNQIAAADTKLKYTLVDIEFTDNKLQATRAEHTQVQSELESEQSGRPKLRQLRQTITDLVQQIQGVQSEIRLREEEIFRDFSQKVGIPNFRQYEEQRERMDEEMSKKRSEFKILKSRIENQLDFERNTTLNKNDLDTMKKSIQDAQNQQKQLEQRDKETATDLEKLAKKTKSLRDNVVKAKTAVEDKENLEMNELKQKLHEINIKTRRLNKHVTAKETQLEQLRSAREELYRKCTVEEIELPLKPLEELSQETGGEGRSKKKRKTASDESMGVFSEEQHSEPFAVSQPATASGEQRVREDHIVIDFSSLEDNLRKSMESDEQHKRMEKEFEDEIAELKSTLEKVAPHLKGVERLRDVEQKLSRTDEEFKSAKEKYNELNKRFEQVKAKRVEMFKKTFDPISKSIDQLYKQLTSQIGVTVGGSAFLHVDNAEEPYSGGIKYTTIPPQKGYRDIEQLSGGEKTVAALALLFAIHQNRPSPFFILDEIDAALDNVNVQRVANFIRNKLDCQFIVISLKETFYAQADSLIGVYRDVAQKCSKTLTLDLTSYTMPQPVIEGVPPHQEEQTPFSRQVFTTPSSVVTPIVLPREE